MSHVMVDGAHVRARVEEGPRGAATVVLLHMAGGGSSAWGPVTSMLGRSLHVVAPDFPAHGQSAGTPAALPVPPGLQRAGITPHLARLAGWTWRMLDELDAARGPVFLAGHSMGGGVALCAALLAPTRVRGVITVGTSGHLRLAPDIRQLVQAEPDVFARTFLPSTLPMGLDSASAARVRPVFPQAAPHVVREDFLGVDGADFLPHVKDLHVPLLAMGGMMDTLTPPEHVRALAAAAPRGRAVLVEGAGHMLPRELPRVVADHVLGFVSAG